jgi:hypothetical protein
MKDIGKRAFKLFKTNAFSVDDVCQALGVDEGTLMREFKAYCGDKFVFPGIYLAGGKDEEIAEALHGIKHVLVRGSPGSGKTINCISALRKSPYKSRKAINMEELNSILGVGFDGIVFMDDVDCYPKKEMGELMRAAAESPTRMLATTTKDLSFPGFQNIDLKPLTAAEMNTVVKSKGWNVPKGTSNLAEIAKINALEGGSGIKDAPGSLSTIAKVHQVLSGKQVSMGKPELEQAFRNAYEIDAKATIENIGAFVGAWLCFYNGMDYSAMPFPKVKGAAAITYRKPVV